jgi:hypothetical protein
MVGAGGSSRGGAVILSALGARGAVAGAGKARAGRVTPPGPSSASRAAPARLGNGAGGKERQGKLIGRSRLQLGAGVRRQRQHQAPHRLQVLLFLTGFRATFWSAGLVAGLAGLLDASDLELRDGKVGLKGVPGMEKTFAEVALHAHYFRLSLARAHQPPPSRPAGTGQPLEILVAGNIGDQHAAIVDQVRAAHGRDRSIILNIDSRKFTARERC